MPPPRFVDTPIQVPDFTSIEVAESFLAKIATLVAGGELDIQTGLELSTLTKNWIDSRHAAKELDLKIISVEGGPHEQTIRIEGGLPTLPGCENLIMPQLNGHAVSEQLLAAPVDVVNESVPPGEAKAQGPHPLQKHHFEEPKTESSPTNGGGEPTP